MDVLWNLTYIGNASKLTRSLRNIKVEILSGKMLIVHITFECSPAFLVASYMPVYHRCHHYREFVVCRSCKIGEMMH